MICISWCSIFLLTLALYHTTLNLWTLPASLPSYHHVQSQIKNSLRLCSCRSPLHNRLFRCSCPSVYATKFSRRSLRSRQSTFLVPYCIDFFSSRRSYIRIGLCIRSQDLWSTMSHSVHALTRMTVWIISLSIFAKGILGEIVFYHPLVKRWYYCKVHGLSCWDRFAGVNGTWFTGRPIKMSRCWRPKTISHLHGRIKDGYKVFSAPSYSKLSVPKSMT